MKTLRLIVACCGVAVTGAAHAHSFGRPYHLPVPFRIYLYGAAEARYRKIREGSGRWERRRNKWAWAAPVTATPQQATISRRVFMTQAYQLEFAVPSKSGAAV